MSKNVLYILWAQLSPVQSLSDVRLCDPMYCIMPGFPNLLKLMSIKLVMPSNHLILCQPLLLPSVFPSIRVFSKESVLHIRWPKYWSFSFNISPSNEYSGLISFRMDLDLLAVQETLNKKHQFFSTHFLCSPTLTSIHDYWKNHSFD